MVLHGGQANITKDELFADESIHAEQALEPSHGLVTGPRTYQEV